MTRHVRLILPLLLLQAACGQSAPRAIVSVDTVEVGIECYPDSTVAVALSPWIRHVPEGGAIEWVLAPPAGTGRVDTFYVEPKPRAAGRWPYDGKPGGKPGTPGRSGPMKGNARPGDRGHYNLVASCVPQGASSPLRIIIDPDVVVDRARQ